MSNVTKGNVKYTIKNGYYIVGDDSDTKPNGIANSDYKGTIAILDTIEGTNVKEIGRNSFFRCQYLTKVFVRARLTSINYDAFCYCIRLEYINIPSSVTLIDDCFCLNTGNGDCPSLPMTIEFEAGRTNAVEIKDICFYARETFYIIYPSTIAPIYTADDAFKMVKNVVICAPLEFQFGKKAMTTTDMLKCPASLNKGEFINTINYSDRRFSVLLLSLMIVVRINSL